jgi:hypothetical protein
MLFAAAALFTDRTGFVGGSACQAQDWASKMFDKTSHDFGTVARGTKAVHRFQIKNVYEEDVHIKSVVSTCGCTTPTILKPDLKTFEVGEIVAEFNTVAFIGQKSATLKVEFDKPFYAEVLLNVGGTIRSDVVVTPGDIEFGTVVQGKPAEKRVSVVYAGRNDWQILDAKTANPNFEIELMETARGGGKVAYEMVVRMLSDAPPGYINDQLILVTNDQKAPELIVAIDGRVTSAITVSPSSLFMGVVHPGQKVKKQLIVRGKKPFRIVDVQCNDQSFSIGPDDQAKTVHMVPVEFTANDTPGKVSREIALTTDQGDGESLVFTAFAQVVSDGGPKRAQAASAEE